MRLGVRRPVPLAVDSGLHRFQFSEQRIRYSSFCTCDTGHPGGLCGAEQRNGAGKRYEPVTVVVSVRLQNLDATPPFVREIARVRKSPVRHCGDGNFCETQLLRGTEEKSRSLHCVLACGVTSVGMTEFSWCRDRSIPPWLRQDGAPKVVLGWDEIQRSLASLRMTAFCAPAAQF